MSEKISLDSSGGINIFIANMHTPLDHIFSLLRILDADKAMGCEFHSSFSLCLNAFNALQSGQFPPLLVCIE